MPTRTMSSNDQAICTWLRATMTARHIKIKGFAADIGIPYRTFHRYHEGERPMTAGDLVTILEHLRTAYGLAPAQALKEIQRIAAAFERKAPTTSLPQPEPM